MGKVATSLILLGLFSAAWAKAPAGAPCPKSRPVEVHLTAGEFKIPAYDARRGLVAVRSGEEWMLQQHFPKTISRTFGFPSA